MPDKRSGEIEDGIGGTLAVGILKYILSIDARLLIELMEVRRDNLRELASLSISIEYSLTAREGGVGDGLSLRLYMDSLAVEESSSVGNERGEVRVTTGSGTAIFEGSGRLFVLGGEGPRWFWDLVSSFSFREGELGLEDNQVLRENIFKAPAPTPLL